MNRSWGRLRETSDIEICELDIAVHRNKAIKVQYTTSHVYEVVASQDATCSGIMFQRTALPEPLSCGSDGVRGSEWLKQPELYGVYADGRITGPLEIRMKNWMQELWITSLFIEPAYRGRGYATCLPEHTRRLVVWRDICCVLPETQSCNDPAIQRYLCNGFVFLGCDLSIASNQNIQGKNVRAEMGCYL